MIGTEKVKRGFRDTQVAQLLMAAQEDSMPALKMDGRDEVLSGLSDMKQVRVVCIE